MDPTETYNVMMQLFERGLHQEAAEHANSLAEWLDRGGFTPESCLSTDGNAAVEFIATDQLAYEYCRAACQLVLDRHETDCDPAPSQP
jgi:hypothetical protein